MGDTMFWFWLFHLAYDCPGTVVYIRPRAYKESCKRNGPNAC
jgi:hypothetical protein